jgi:diguanylate cyclase
MLKLMDLVPVGRVRRTEIDSVADTPLGRARLDGVFVDSRGKAATPEPSTDIGLGEWEDLLCAVKDRLRQTVAEPIGGPQAAHPHDILGSVQASVLDCVAALDQLHATLSHELGRRQGLELQVFDALTELAQVRAELVGTRSEEKRSRHLALHDSLTSLPNHGCFRDRLCRALARAESERQALAVLYLDLDDFRSINTSHGRDVGDDVLRIVAARLTRALRTDDLVGRLGGDEFACMLTDWASQEQLSQVACNLYDTVSAPVQLGEIKLTVHPSIGIAMRPAAGATCEALIKNADAAMLHAKRLQSGYAFFDLHTALQ